MYSKKTRVAAARGGTSVTRHPAAGRLSPVLKGRRILRDPDSTEGEDYSTAEDGADTTVVPGTRSTGEGSDVELSAAAKMGD